MEMAFLSGGMPDILKLVNVSGVIPALFYLVCTVLLVRFNSDFLMLWVKNYRKEGSY